VWGLPCCRGEASCTPSTTLRVVPLPRVAWEDRTPAPRSPPLRLKSAAEGDRPQGGGGGSLGRATACGLRVTGGLVARRCHRRLFNNHLLIGRRNGAPSGICRMIASRWLLRIRRREPASLMLAGNDAIPDNAERGRHVSASNDEAGLPCQDAGSEQAAKPVEPSIATRRRQILPYFGIRGYDVWPSAKSQDAEPREARPEGPSRKTAKSTGDQLLENKRFREIA